MEAVLEKWFEAGRAAKSLHVGLQSLMHPFRSSCCEVALGLEGFRFVFRLLRIGAKLLRERPFAEKCPKADLCGKG